MPSLTRQNPPSDGDITSKGALFVNVGALNGLLGRLEAQTDIFVVSGKLLLASFSKQDPLLILKDGWLLLVGTLSPESLELRFNSEPAFTSAFML